MIADKVFWMRNGTIVAQMKKKEEPEKPRTVGSYLRLVDIQMLLLCAGCKFDRNFKIILNCKCIGKVGGCDAKVRHLESR